MEIQFVSATWCKACVKIKEPFIAHCKAVGIEPTWLDYDTMSEEDKETIKSLPTIMVRMGSNEPWIHYAASDFEDWKNAVAITALKTVTALQTTSDF
jgi:hypothetical protein